MSGHSLRRHLWRRPSPAGVLAVVALMLACAGSAVAGSLLSVGAGLKRASATPAELNAPAVGAAKAKATVAQSGQVLGRHSTAIGSDTIRFVDSTVAGNAFFDATAMCDPGEAISGGGVLDTGSANFGDAISNSAPVVNGAQSGWFGQVINAGSSGENFTVYAVCLT
jgi:hypothetical protein